MKTALVDITAGQASEELARRGVPPDEKVVVVRKSDMLDLADRIRAEAMRRGMTEELFKDLMKDE
jgi:hypothetical protein